MNVISYPEKLEIVPLGRPPCIEIEVPGSKSITNRALVLAALARRQSACVLSRALRSEDTEMMIGALQSLGFPVHVDWDAAPPTVTLGPHLGPIIPVRAAN